MKFNKYIGNVSFYWLVTIDSSRVLLFHYIFLLYRSFLIAIVFLIHYFPSVFHSEAVTSATICISIVALDLNSYLFTFCPRLG